MCRNKLVLLALGLDASRALVVELLHIRNGLLENLLVALRLVLALLRQLLCVLLFPLTVYVCKIVNVCSKKNQR